MAVLLQTISNEAPAYLGYGVWADGSIGQTFTVDFYGSIEEIWFGRSSNTGTDHYIELYDAVGGNLLATGTPSVLYPERFTLDVPVTVESGEDFYVKFYDATDGYMLVQVGTLDHTGGTMYVNDVPYVWAPYTDFYVRLYGTSEISKATNPTPADGAEGVSKHTTILSWDAAPGAETYDVYLDDGILGTSDLIAEDVADTSLTLTAEMLSGVTGDNQLAWGQQYFWRVDSKAEGYDTVTGDEWNFTTELFTNYPQVNNGQGVDADPGDRNIIAQIRRFIVAAGNGIWVGE